MHKPAQKNILFAAACLLCAAMLLFFIWLYASLHTLKRIDPPTQNTASQSEMQWDIFDIELGERVVISGRAAHGENAVRRFATRVALVYDSGEAVVLPTRMVGSNLYFDNSCFLSMASVGRLPEGTAQIVILFPGEPEETAIYTGQFLSLGGDRA